MNNSDFTHLHVHSEYSLLDGLGKPEHYIERAKELGFKALAVTDHGNIDAHLKWQRVCKKNEFIPIFGCELYIVEDMQKKEKKEIRKHMTVLVKNLEGWQALARILTISNLEGFYGKPRIDGRTLLDNINAGLIVMTGCAGSFLSLPQGESLLVGLRDKGVNCYLEVMPHTIQVQIDINQICIGMNQKYSIPFVATNDCHYVRAEHAKAQEVLLAVQRQAKWKDPDRWRFGFDGLHLRTADEMIQKFKEQGTLSRSQYTKAMMNTRVVADQCCNFRLQKQNINLPLTSYEKEYSEMTADEILAQFCSLKREEMQLSGQWQFEYRSRYAHEMEIICRKEFARYFLIVYEIVEWCKKNGVMVGPGRGSVGGSLVAYLLNITQVDPLRYDLLFERFISEDRIDYPDIDLDFEDVKCHLVRQHLEEQYGQYNVVGISTFLTMKGRAVIRDVGRVFDLPVEDVDSFAKSIRAGDHEEDIIANAGQETKEGKYFAQKYPEEFRLACILEGQIRGAGQHPAGLILSGRDLRNGENCALYRRSDSLVCNWDMEDCERNGLIKIDILKLSTLTVLNEAKRLIFQNVGNILYFHPESDCYLIGKTEDITDELVDLGKFDYSLLPLNDRKVFDMLSQGDTSGVFQFSGYACTDLCKQMGIDNFEDMAVVTALARPGPAESGMTSLYVRRKKGEQWEPLHPAYEAITKNTYGVMVYQEQMMRAMTDLAGFSNSDADRIRKVIGKKRKIEEFEPYRLSFLEGCQRKRTLTDKQVVEFWEGLLAWAHYGFNKSHAVEYAMIGYYTAWLKVYHLTEFFCAQLTYGVEKEGVVREAERKGMKIVTPKVGVSDARRWIARKDLLYMPFIEINGVGENQADKCALIKISSPKISSRKGFFELKRKPAEEIEAKTKLEKLMLEICAFNPDPLIGPEEPLNYFQYSIGQKENGKREIEVIRKQMLIDPLVRRCKACGLRNQADRVVSSSLGMYNVLALGEASGREEDAQGMGFVGDAGKVLWDEIVMYGITRRMIHVGNCCKCFVNPNTQIYTSKGLKNISEIKLGDLVLTHKGRFKKVVWIRPKETIKRREFLVRIKYKGGRPAFRIIDVTLDHPFLIRDKWVKAKDICEGDLIRALAKRCSNCGIKFSFDRKGDFCSRRCAIVFNNKNRNWSENSRKKVSKNMKRLYKRGILDGKVLTKNANEVTRQKVKDGSWHLLAGPNRPPCFWKGQTRYENESLNRATVNMQKTFKRKGYDKKLAKCGTKALKKYYETHDYKLPSGNVKNTRIEQIMAWALRKRGISFLQNSYLNGFYPDVLIEDHKIIIECDGTYWHSSDEAKMRDRKRGMKLKKAGYTMLRFSENEIKKDVFKCVDEVERIMANHDGEYEFTEVEVVSKKIFEVFKPKILYNFGVEGDESYIADGLVSHNCWPSKSRTPSKEQIDECFGRWMKSEILSMNCRLILATGNLPLYALTGRESGITSISGQMEWVEKVKAWVVWCVHPSAVLRNRRSNLGPFQKGIRTFAEAFNRVIKKKQKV